MKKRYCYLYLVFITEIFLIFSSNLYISCNFLYSVSSESNEFSQSKNILYFLQYPYSDFVDSDTVIDSIISSGYKTVIMDYSYDGSDQKAFTKEQIDKLKVNGIIPICYISIGEAENYRFYWEEDGNDWINESTGELNQNAPDWLGPVNPDWSGNYKVKYWRQGWKDIIKTYLDKILKAGFSGIYLDIVDAYYFWSDESEENKTGISYPVQDTAKWMIDFIKEIADYTREKSSSSNFYVFPQNGVFIVDDVGSQITDSGLFYYDLYYETISGVGVEDLFYTSIENEDGTFNFIKNFELTADDYASYKRRIELLNKLQGKDKIVFVVDYIDDKSGYKGENKERIDDFISKVKEEGFYYYIGTTDRSLDEINPVKY